jgi:chlorobactene glucosyltransferase
VRARTALTGAAAATWGWAVAVGLLDRRVVPALADVEPETAGPLVTAVVPGRDEEGRVAPALRSLVAQTYPALEVVFVDDESRDGTLAEAMSVERESERIRVVSGKPLPPGWVGKSWATHQGASEARGDWLLFTDADVVHAPEAVARALALARRLGRGITVLPRSVCETPGERIVQPAAAALIRGFVAPGPLVRSSRFPTAFGIGGFILVERGLYERVGGHEAVRDRLVDDFALAALLKRAGSPLAVATGRDQVRVRMYDGAREVWRGWRKNSSAGIAEGSLPGAVALAAFGLVAALMPALAIVRGPRGLGLLAFALQTWARIAIDAAAPTPRRYWLTLPLGGAFLSTVSLVSSLDRVRGGVEWRGRRYA